MADITVNQAQEILRDVADQLGRGVFQEVSKRIIDRTPVETGRTKANWNASIDAPDATVRDATDASGAATIARMRGAVANAERGTRCI